MMMNADSVKSMKLKTTRKREVWGKVFHIHRLNMLNFHQQQSKINEKLNKLK